MISDGSKDAVVLLDTCVLDGVPWELLAAGKELLVDGEWIATEGVAATVPEGLHEGELI